MLKYLPAGKEMRHETICLPARRGLIVFIVVLQGEGEVQVIHLDIKAVSARFLGAGCHVLGAGCQVFKPKVAGWFI